MDFYGIEQANRLAYEQYELALQNNHKEIIVVIMYYLCVVHLLAK
jgi:hypothetical protein